MRSRRAAKRLRNMTGRVWAQGVLGFCQSFIKQCSLLLTGAGTVSTDELPSMLTSLGYAATEDDVAAQTHQVVQQGLAMLWAWNTKQHKPVRQLRCFCAAG